MISFLEGVILNTTSDYLVILVGGIGYKVFTSKKHGMLGDKISIFIHYHVGSDNQPQLFGMKSTSELEIFHQLLKVSGVGPKIALKIVESETYENLEKAIIEGDITFFTRVKGLGKKNAQKIILELKNKIVEPGSGLDSDFTYQALSSLGFTKKEIITASAKIDKTGLSDEDLIQSLLQVLGK